MNLPIPKGESLTVEFKSDRKRLPDAELVEAVVCLANAEGGELWLGVEDDGTPTGLHPDHFLLTGLAGMVAARTSPSVNVNVSSVEVGGVAVACIQVPKAQGEVATQGGVYLRQHGRIKRAEAMELCRLSEGHVKSLLKRMCKAGFLKLVGAGPAAHYRIGPSDRVVSDEIG